MQKLLLDTQVFLWWLNDDQRLGNEAKELISNQNNEIFISAVSGWEISIKRRLGKLKAPEYLNEIVEKAGFEHLPVTFLHGETAVGLPMYHRDPFDRMLVAQAQVEGLILISSDKLISRYEIKTIKA